MNKRIPIPQTLQIGGYDYLVLCDAETDKTLALQNAVGTEDEHPPAICLCSTLCEQEFSNVFIHEILHAVGRMYYNNGLDEGLVVQVANGLHQVFEEMGVRFVRSE